MTYPTQQNIREALDSVILHDGCDYISCYLDVIHTVLESSLWNTDMESAPKDGRKVILGYRNSMGKWRSVMGRWLEDVELQTDFDMAEPGFYETSENADEECNVWPIDPTHWKPLIIGDIE